MALSIESHKTTMYSSRITVCRFVFFRLFNNNYYNRLLYTTNIIIYDNWSTQSGKELKSQVLIHQYTIFPSPCQLIRIYEDKYSD